MYERLLFSFNVVFPLFAMIILGMFLQWRKSVNESWVTVTNSLGFRFALPASLFNSIYVNQVDLNSRLPALGFVFVVLLLLFLILLWLIPKLIAERSRRGVIIQGLVQSNTILLGIPLISNLYGSAGAGELSALLMVTIPMFNIMAVLSYSFFADESASNPSLKQLLRGIATHPLILASLTGLLFVLMQWRLPLALERTIGDLAKIASPLALLALGAGFKFRSIGSNLRQLTLVAMARLILVPSILLTIAVQMGFHGMQLAAMLIIFAAPLAISSYVMAYEAKVDYEFCGQLIVATTLGSCFTLFGFIFVLSSMGLI